MQPTPPREALLVCSAPGTLQRRAAALSSGSALLGVRSAGGGTPQVGAPVRSERSAWEQRLARRGRREKASSKGEASSHAARASSSPRSGQLTGSPKGLGARSPLPRVPSNSPSFSLLTPEQGHALWSVSPLPSSL